MYKPQHKLDHSRIQLNQNLNFIKERRIETYLLIQASSTIGKLTQLVSWFGNSLERIDGRRRKEEEEEREAMESREKEEINFSNQERERLGENEIFWDKYQINILLCEITKIPFILSVLNTTLRLSSYLTVITW
jgi:hypothetical protein